MKFTNEDNCTIPLLCSSLNGKNHEKPKSKIVWANVEQKCQGSFVWSSGATYEGHIINGQRTGNGRQTWANGSSYEGEFMNDMRHGIGQHVWSSGEAYKGHFYKDHRHGFGEYKWPDGSSYSGTFYLDRKEGYGTFNFSNGDVFSGLYKKGERFGPGILSYKDSSKQDVGLWYREKLIRLCSIVEGIFTMKNHPEYQYYPNEHLSRMFLKEEDCFEEMLLGCKNSLHFGSKDLNSGLIYDESYLPGGIEYYSKDFENLPRPVGLRESLDSAFFDECYSLVRNDKDAFLLAKNNTPLLMDVQKQIYKHRHQAASFNALVAMIEETQREVFELPKGPLENMSENLISASAKGEEKLVYTYLTSGLVNPNVCDIMGNTPLMGAAINCHIHIVNMLLDMGADINQLNDEGVSALTACHIFYYPIEHFKPNIAEKYACDYLNSKKKYATQMKATSDCKIGHYDHRRGSKTLSLMLNDKSQQKIAQVGGLKSSSICKSPVISKNQEQAHKDAIECCRSDVKIKAHFREISSARSMSQKQKMENDFNAGDIPAKSIHSSSDMSIASKKNLIGFHMDIPDDLIERTATLLSMNRRAVSGISTRDGQAITLGKTGALAVWKAEHQDLQNMIELLLQRGANADNSSVPMPALFFAVKAGDTDAIRLFLLKGASTETRISSTLGGFTPLHIASAIPGKEGVLAVKLLLQAGANPNASAHDEEILYDKRLKLGSISTDFSAPIKKSKSSSQWVSQGLKNVDESGRTPLHIACSRDDDYKHASDVVHELLDNGADPDVIWSGHSPLSLAICSGNDSAIEALLRFGADASMPLKRGVGNALCACANTEYEYRRIPDNRIKLVNKLVDAGASMLAPVVFGSKQVTGTVVDYAHWMFGKDTRIAHTPYHALTHQERDTYNARKHLLAHFGDLLRESAIKVEREKLRKEYKFGVRTKVILQKLWQDMDQKGQKSKAQKYKDTDDVDSILDIDFQDIQDVIASTEISRKTDYDTFKDKKILKGRSGSGPIRKPLFRYCYECGRSVGVRLTTCSRCKEVHFCSRSCKLKAWEERHKNECLRMKPTQQLVSPSPTEIASYFTTQTMSEAIAYVPDIDSIKISPSNIRRNTEFLPISKSEKIATSKCKLSKVKQKNRRRTTSSKSAMTQPSSSKLSSRRAYVSKNLHEKVGKEIDFGTTGMTLAELGITENYSFN